MGEEKYIYKFLHMASLHDRKKWNKREFSQPSSFPQAKKNALPLEQEKDGTGSQKMKYSFSVIYMEKGRCLQEDKKLIRKFGLREDEMTGKGRSG